MNRKKMVSTALAAALVAAMGATTVVSAATPVANNDLAYKGDINLMHFSTSEEA